MSDYEDSADMECENMVGSFRRTTSKRKSIECMETIEKEIKKLKLFCTPGELCLRNDLTALQSKQGRKYYDLTILDPSCVQVIFLDHTLVTWTIQIHQRYPHTPPDIFYSCPANEHDTQSYLCPTIISWTPVHGLSDAIDFISLCRKDLLTNSSACTCEVAMGIEDECNSVSDLYSA
jgi:hypothetical protein